MNEDQKKTNLEGTAPGKFIKECAVFKKSIDNEPLFKNQNPETCEETSLLKETLKDARKLFEGSNLPKDERSLSLIAHLIGELDDVKIWLDLSENRRDYLMEFLLKKCIPAETPPEKIKELMPMIWKAALIGAGVPEAINNADEFFEDYGENEED